MIETGDKLPTPEEVLGSGDQVTSEEKLPSPEEILGQKKNSTSESTIQSSQPVKQPISPLDLLTQINGSKQPAPAQTPTQNIIDVVTGKKPVPKEEPSGFNPEKAAKFNPQTSAGGKQSAQSNSNLFPSQEEAERLKQIALDEKKKRDLDPQYAPLRDEVSNLYRDLNIGTQDLNVKRIQELNSALKNPETPEDQKVNLQAELQQLLQKPATEYTGGGTVATGETYADVMNRLAMTQNLFNVKRKQLEPITQAADKSLKDYQDSQGFNPNEQGVEEESSFLKALGNSIGSQGRAIYRGLLHVTGNEDLAKQEGAKELEDNYLLPKENIGLGRLGEMVGNVAPFLLPELLGPEAATAAAASETGMGVGGLTLGLSKLPSAAKLAKAGLGFGIGALSTKGTVYDQVYQQSLDQGMNEQQATEKARHDSNVSAVANGLVFGAGGYTENIGKILYKDEANELTKILVNSGINLAEFGASGAAEDVLNKNPVGKGFVDRMEGMVPFVATMGVLHAAPSLLGKGLSKAVNIVNRSMARRLGDVETQVNLMIKNGEMTPEEGVAFLKPIQERATRRAMMPDNISNSKDDKIDPLLKQKLDLIQKLKKLDTVFHPQINDQIKAIDDQIAKINSEPDTKEETEAKNANIAKKMSSGLGLFAEEQAHYAANQAAIDETVKQIQAEQNNNAGTLQAPIENKEPTVQQPTLAEPIATPEITNEEIPQPTRLKTKSEPNQWGPRLKELTQNPDEYGETFTPDGAIVKLGQGKNGEPGEQSDDVVTLANDNVKPEELTPERIEEFKQKHKDLFDSHPDAVIGVYKYQDGPNKGNWSIDANVVVDAAHRENTLEFAKKNNQESIYSAELGDTIPTGGKGEPTLTKSEEHIAAAKALSKGEKYEFPKKPTHVFYKPIETVKNLIKEYKSKFGIKTSEGKRLEFVDEERAKKIADAFEKMKHDPDNPEVKKAYKAFVDETIQQAKFILGKTGLKIEMSKTGDEYASPKDMLDDIRNNNHLYVFDSESGFGDTPITDEMRKTHPLLQDSGLKDINGVPMKANDVFRWVHDYISHGERGSDFSAVGEENAWDSHSRLYSPLARRAMTTETRGQNSWTNYGPHMVNEDGTFKPAEGDNIKYSPQKVGLLPEEFTKTDEELKSEKENLTPGQLKVKKAKEAIEAKRKAEAEQLAADQKAVKKYTAANIDSIDTSNKKGTQKTVLEDAKNVVKSIAKLVKEATGHDLTLHVHEKESTFNQAVKDAGGDLDGGRARGMYLSSDGTIHLNMEHVSPDTMFHEGFHPIMDLLAKNDAKGFDDLHSQLQKLAKSNPEVARIFENNEGLLSDDASTLDKKEALTTLIGKVASGDISLENPTLKDRIKQIINSALKFVGMDKIPAALGIDLNTTAGLKDLASMLVEQVKSGKEVNIPNIINNIEIGPQFLKFGGFTKNGFEESQEYKNLVKSGHIVENFDIKNLAGKPVFVINPDNMLTGTVEAGGKVLAKGEGGINFISNTGDLWAFSKTGRGKTNAKLLVRFINDQIEKNGVAYVVFSKGTLGKLLSSHQGARGAMAVLENLASKGLIPRSEFRKALIAAGKIHNIDFNGKNDSVNIHKDLVEKFVNKSDNSFQSRGTFVNDVINELSTSTGVKENIKKIREELNTKELPGSSARKTGDIDFTPAGVKDAIGLLFSDQATVGAKNSDVYAAAKITKPVEVKEGSHETYGYHVGSVNSEERPVLMLLKDKYHVVDLVNDASGKPTTERNLGSNQIGLATGIIKNAENIKPSKTEGPQFQKVDLVKDTYYEPHLTQSKDGEDYVFFHTSNADEESLRKGINSSKYSSLATSREEKATQYGVASFYTKPNDGERMVSGEQYAVHVPKDKVYPMDTDPNGYGKIAEKKIPKNAPFRSAQIKKAIAESARKDGYLMGVGEWGYDRATGKSDGIPAMRADAFVPLKPEAQVENKYVPATKEKIPHPEKEQIIKNRKMDNLMGAIADMFSAKGKFDEAYDIATKGRDYGSETLTPKELAALKKDLPQRMVNRMEAIEAPQFQKESGNKEVNDNHDAFVDAAKERIKEEENYTIDDFAKELGYDAKDLQGVWEDANITAEEEKQADQKFANLDEKTQKQLLDEEQQQREVGETTIAPKNEVDINEKGGETGTSGGENKQAEEFVATTKAKANVTEPEYTPIRKAELTDAKDNLAKRGIKWSETMDSAMANLAKETPERGSLYETALNKIKVLQDRLRNGESINPNSEEVATLAFARAKARQEMADLYEDMSDPNKKHEAEIKYRAAEANLTAIDEVLGATAAEAGRAFNLRQIEGKMDADEELKIRRMQIEQATGKPLTKEMLDTLENLVDESKRINDQLDKLQGNDADFEKAVQAEVDKRVGEKKMPGKYEAKAKTLADNIRKLKDKPFTFTDKDGNVFEMKQNSIIPYNDIIEGIAVAVEKTGALADAVKTTLSKYSDSEWYKKMSDDDRSRLADQLSKHLESAEPTAINEVKKYAEIDKSTTITKKMVADGLIDDLIKEHIEKGTNTKDILKNVTNELQKQLPDVTESQVRDAYLKDGEFKLEKQEKIKSDIAKAKEELKSISKLQRDIEALENGKKAKVEAASGNKKAISEYEQSLKDKKQNLIDQKRQAESELKKAAYEKKKEELAEQKRKFAETQKAIDEQQKAADKMSADAMREKNIADQKAAQEKLAEIEKQRKALKEEKAANDKESIKIAKEENAKQAKIDEINQKIADVESEGKLWDKTKKSSTVDNDIAEAKKKLDDAIRKAGIKVDRNSRENRDAKEQAASAHNDRIEDLKGEMNTHLMSGSLTPEEKSAMADARDKALAAKIDVNSKQDIDQMGKNSTKRLQDLYEQVKKKAAELDSDPLREVQKSLKDTLRAFDADKEKTSRSIQTNQRVKTLESGIKERERQLAAGEFERRQPQPRVEKTAEIVKLEIEKRKLDAQFKDLAAKENEKNKSAVKKTVEFVMKNRTASLIFNLWGLTKIGLAGATKPVLETITRSTTGSLANLINKGLSRAASGEGKFSIKQEVERYRSMFSQMKPQELEARRTENSKQLTEATQKFNDAKDKLDSLTKGSKEYNAFENGEYAKAKAEYEKANLNVASNVIYDWLGASSSQDAGKIWSQGLSHIEEAMGEKIPHTKDELKSLKEKYLYVAESMGRIHSMIKNFSARGEFAANFMTRLEQMQRAGKDISDPGNLILAADASYNDGYLRGKYMTDNAITEHAKGIISDIESGRYDYLNKHPKIRYAVSKILNFDAPIVKVPMNILNEAVSEYTMGSLIGGITHIAENVKGFKLSREEGKSIRESLESMQEHIAQLPPEKADFILRCYRKGGLGLGLVALSALTGAVGFGGFYRKGEPKKNEDDLGFGDMSIGGKVLPKRLSKAITHLPATMPALLALNYMRVRDLEENGRNVPKNPDEARQAAAMADLEAIMDENPYRDIFNPGKQLKSFIPIPGINLAKDVAEQMDTDENGNLVQRNPNNIVERVKASIPGLRKEVPEKEPALFKKDRILLEEKNKVQKSGTSESEKTKEELRSVSDNIDMQAKIKASNRIMSTELKKLSDKHLLHPGTKETQEEKQKKAEIVKQNQERIVKIKETRARKIKMPE